MEFDVGAHPQILILRVGNGLAKIVHVHEMCDAHLLEVARAIDRLAFSFALDKAGKSIAANMAMIAITTNSSINVNAFVIPPVDSCFFSIG